MKTSIFEVFYFVFTALTAGLIILSPIVLYLIYYKSEDMLSDIISYALGTLSILLMGLLSRLMSKMMGCN